MNKILVACMLSGCALSTSTTEQQISEQEAVLIATGQCVIGTTVNIPTARKRPHSFLLISI
jgi:hypothetical protein